jgi:hypothetical protein
MEIFNIAYAQRLLSASPTPNVPNRKSLNFQERRPAVENVEVEEVERVENAEAFYRAGSLTGK